MIKLSGVKKSVFNVKLRLLVGGSAKANMAIAPTLSQYGLNLREFTNFFETKSFFVNNGIEIGCSFSVIKNKIANFNLKTPSSSFFVKHFFLFKDVDSLTKEDLLKLVYEYSKLKLSSNEVSHLVLFSFCKSQLSVLRSFTSGELNTLSSIL